MKKKIVLIIFTIVCTLGITAFIASFMRGADSGVSTTGGSALSGIYDSYVTQIQRIIDNSNSTDTDMTLAQKQYHIVQIVDSLETKDADAQKIKDYLVNYINNQVDSQTAANIFRTDIIGKAMKEKMIDIQTFKVNDPMLAAAIANADLIYIANTNNSYSKGNDLYTAGDSSENAKSQLEKYALDSFKPIILDAEVITRSNNTGSSTSVPPTNIYEYLKSLKAISGTTSDNGVFSVRGKENSDGGYNTIPFSDYFNMQFVGSTYVSFNNMGTAKWNTYPADFKFNVLEIVANDAEKAKETSLKKEIDANGMAEAFSYPTRISKDNINYICMTVAEFNAEVQKRVAAGATAKNSLYLGDDIGNTDTSYESKFPTYQFVYLNHENSKKLYEANTLDFTDESINALKGFVARGNKSRQEKVKTPDYISRLMVDANFYNVGYTSASDSTQSSNVDNTTSLYAILSKMIELNGTTVTANATNIEVVNQGFFKNKDNDMLYKENDSATTKAQRITDLINRSTYRDYNVGSNAATFKVLEIEPYYQVDDTSWYKNEQETLTNTLNASVAQEASEAKGSPFYRFNLTQARVAAATGLNVNQISVSTVSANEISSTSPNLVEEYDMIFIGNNHGTIKEKKDWTLSKILSSYKGGNFINMISYNLNDLEKLVFNTEKFTGGSTFENNDYVYQGYAHTGELVKYDDQGTIISFNGAWKAYSRTNGSDITSKVYAQLYNYISAGMPVIVDKTVMDSNYLIGGARANAELEEDNTHRIKLVGKNSGSMNRLKLKNTKGKSTITYKDKSGNWRTIDYNSTSYSDDTMVARRESKIDPESYLYQLMYLVAEKKDSGIYHAGNVFAGFDATDTQSLSNLYFKGKTADTDLTAPEDIDVSQTGAEKLVVDNAVGDNNITLFNNTVAYDGDNIDYANSGSAIQLKHFLNNYASARPVINLVTAPKSYDSDNDADVSKRVINPKSPTFKFSITGLTGAKCKVQLYYDFDGDGQFSDDETEGRLEGTTYETEEVAKIDDYEIGTTGVVTFNEESSYVKKDFVIDKDFVGVMPYKLVVTDENGKATSIIRYPKYYNESDSGKQKIRLLQVVPGEPDGNHSDGLTTVTTLCVNEGKDKSGSVEKGNFVYGTNCVNKDGKIEHEFGIRSFSDKDAETNQAYNLAKSLSDEYDIELDILTFGQLSYAATGYIEDYCQKYGTSAGYETRDQLTDKEKSAFEKFRNKYYNESTKTMNSVWDNLVKIGNTTVYDFKSMGICDKILNGWFKEGKTSDEITYTYNGKTYSVNAGYYDMVILGFSQLNGMISGGSKWCDINNIGCQFIRSFIAADGSVLFGSDTTSYAGFNEGIIKWSRNINEYLRESFGMDRFKYTVEKQADSTGSQAASFYTQRDTNNAVAIKSYLYEPYTSDTPEVGDNKPGEFYSTNSYDGTYEKADDNNDGISGAGFTDALVYGRDTKTKSTIFNGVDNISDSSQAGKVLPTNRIVRNNTGLLTNYPFTITSDPFISKAGAQYLALDTEDQDMHIWYSLAGSNGNNGSALYAADPKNGRSFYYMYTYKSVTYTAAGYTDFANTSIDNDGERKLIINSILNNVKQHRSGPEVIFEKYSGKTDAVFTPAKGKQDATLTCKGQTPDKCCFNIKITVGSGKTLKKAHLYIDANANGKYDEGDSDLGDYADKIISGTSFAIDASKLDAGYMNSIATYMQSGTFYIGVDAKDSDGKTGTAKMYVKTQSKLFNLN